MSVGLFFSDLHVAANLPLAKKDPGGVSSDRLRDTTAIIDQVARFAEESGAAFVACLGDLFDASQPDGATLVAASRALGALAQKCPTYILPGNHDAVDRDGRLYSLQFYGELKVPNLTILGHETVEPVPGVLLHAVPWLPEERARKRIRTRAAQIDEKKRNVLVFHQGIRGALWDSGRPSEDGLDPEIGEGFDLALTGHYHRPQKFGENGYYLGAPLDLRFGDEAVTSRGFWAVNFGRTKLVPNLIATKYPRFQTLRIDLREGEDLKGQEPQTLIEGDVEYLRIVVEGPAAVIDASRDTLKEWQAAASGWGLRALKLDVRPVQTRRTRLEVDSGLSHSDLVRTYASKFAPDGTDAGPLAEIGVRFLEES